MKNVVKLPVFQYFNNLPDSSTQNPLLQLINFYIEPQDIFLTFAQYVSLKVGVPRIVTLNKFVYVFQMVDSPLK